jgi:signal transduction histidine kinase/integral membrane sensor domain MASE1
VLPAPLGFAVTARWLAATDLLGSLRPTLWLLFGMLLTDVYLLGVLAAPPGYISPIPLFLPQAVILSVLLLTEPRRWLLPLVVYYVYLVVHVIWRGNPVGVAVFINVADVIEALAGAVLIRRFVPRATEFSNLTSVSTYVACVTLGSILGATWASTVWVFHGRAFWDIWPKWFLSDVLASLAVAPMILLWVRAGRAGLRAQSRARLIEAVALGSSFFVLAGLRLATSEGENIERTILRYLSVLLLLWAAIRFGPRGMMTALSAVIVISIAIISNESGPSAPTNLVTLQVFLLMIGVPLFGLAVLVQERQESQERYRAVLANLPHSAVLLFGPDLRLRFADGQGLAELGLPKPPILDQPVAAVFPAPVASVLAPHYQGALAGAPASLDLSYQERVYHAEVLPLTVAAQPAGMLLVRDVTEERRAGELAVANAELARLNRAKSDFVSVVSHEFRTPLTGIQAFSELIRDEEFPAAQVKEYAGDINREAQRLGRMISELLDLDRMESGQMTLQVESLGLNALIMGAVASMSPNAPQHTLQLALDPALPSLPGDRDKLTQVVVNLLSNAIKYSPEGGTVTVGTARVRSRAHLWVRDQGIGIPPEALEAVFERYVRLESRADGTANGMVKGTGLGLPIVRQIAELHRGSAWAESEVGRGSTFHVMLPLQSERPPGKAQPPDRGEQVERA